MELAKMIDHTNLKPEAAKKEIMQLCKEAAGYGFYSVCVNSCYVSYCRECLRGTDVKVCTVIGFPLGAMSLKGKQEETKAAVEDGADEVDMVAAIGMIKSKDWDYVRKDIKAVVNAADGKAVVKVIIETCLLTEEEKIRVCRIAKEAGADYVKTSTGFSSGGATAEDIALMRRTVGPEMGVKASGGVRTKEAAEEMIKAGASRIGTSSGIQMVRG